MSESTDIYVRHGLTGEITTIPRTYLKTKQSEHWAWQPISEAEARADARYVRNAGGTVHSVPSAGLADLLSLDGMTQVTEAEAREAAPELFAGEAS